MMMMQRNSFRAMVALAAGAVATASHAQTQSEEMPTSTPRPVTAERLGERRGGAG